MKIGCAGTGVFDDISAQVILHELKRVFLATFQHRPFLVCAETDFLTTFQHRPFLHVLKRVVLK